MPTNSFPCPFYQQVRKEGDEEDVIYINDKNKQFNQKLAMYYNIFLGSNISAAKII